MLGGRTVTQKDGVRLDRSPCLPMELRMPILAAEPCLFPHDLLQRDFFCGPAGPRWWAVYTLSRHEKTFMRRLRVRDVPHYGPMIAKRTRSPRGRMRTAHVPLFANYVFVFGGDEARHEVLTTNCVSRCLEVPNVEQFVADLRQIQRLIDSNAALTPESRLMPGRRVRIRGGCLTGMEGVIVQRRGESRLLISVDFLQRGASIAVDDFDVEAID
jgi:transcription antitermination factor NusG